MIILLRTKLYDSYKNEKKKMCNVKPLNIALSVHEIRDKRKNNVR